MLFTFLHALSCLPRCLQAPLAATIVTGVSPVANRPHVRFAKGGAKSAHPVNVLTTDLFGDLKT